MIHQLVSRNLLHTISAQDLASLIDELDLTPNELDPAGKIIPDTAQKVLGNPDSPLNAFNPGWDTADIALAAEFWSVGSLVAEKLGLRSTAPHLLINGRVSDSVLQ